MVDQDPFGIYKAEKRKEPSGATIAGAGATTAGVGYLAGGTPRKKVSLEGINFNEKPKNARQLVGDKARVASRMGQGGILGFRTTVHEGGLYGFNQAATKDKWSGAPKDSKTAFRHGRNAGKIAPEVKVIRHMSGGRKAAHALAASGVAAAGYGAGKERKQTVKKADSRRKSDAWTGAGAAGAGISGGGGALLSSQRRRWSKEASRNIDAGGKLVPATAGRRKGRFGRTTMDPSVTDGAIVRNKLLSGVDVDSARKLGQHRGAAAQARHFAHVYGSTGKVVALGGGAASAAALYRGAKGKKTQVQKNLSAFGVDHG